MLSSSHRQLLFIMISLGTSFSLGNLWRFPFVVSENGGGSFVFLYITLGFLVGLPVLILEMFLASQIQNDRTKKVYWLVPLILSFFVLSYYSVISGWVLFFLTDFLMLILDTTREPQRLYVLFTHPWLQWLLASVHIIIFISMWLKQKESILWRFRAVALPLIIITLGLLLYQSLRLSSIGESVRYLFYPDFEKWSRYSIGHAVGHVFFTLTVGFGVFLTVREFYDSKDHTPTIAMKMTTAGILFSLVSLVVVFPLVFIQRNQTQANPFMLFDYLPPSFLNFKYGLGFGFLFFLVLYVSALNGSLILFRALVNLVRPVLELKYRGTVDVPSHRKIGIWAGAGLFIFSVVPAMGFPFYLVGKINNFNLVEKMDHFLIHWLLPLGVLSLLLNSRKLILSYDFKQFIISQGHASSEWLYVPLKLLLLYFIPLLILTGLFTGLF